MKVSTTMKDTMEAEHWVPELRVCYQPPDALPSDTRLHCLLVALLGVRVQENAPLHARLWDDHHHVPLDHLQGTGVQAPTIVWLSGKPTTAYWQWSQTSPAPPVTVTTAVLAPNNEPRIWFHDLPALGTLHGAITAVDVGTTAAGMAMAGVAQCGHGAYQAHVASAVGTSQEGEAMILLLYVRRLAEQPGVYWLVPDSEAVVGALRAYQEGGHCRDGIHHLYATVLGGRCLALASAINAVTTPSQWITGLNVRVDAATQEPPEVDLTWLLRCPFSFLPP